MNKQETVFIPVLIVLSVLLLVPVVSAAALTSTWNPLGGITNFTNQTTSFAFNCTTSAAIVINVTVFANDSAGVENSLLVVTNTSSDQTAWTGTVTITSADDGALQNISCFADNSTAQLYSNENLGRGIMLDSTNPTCSISSQHAVFAFKGLNNVEYESADNIERVSTSVDVDGPGQQVTITVTAQNGPVELRSNDTAYVGDWATSIIVTDRPGNTCNASATFRTYLPGGDIGDVGEQDVSPLSNNQKVFWVVAIAGIVWFVWFRK